MNRALALMATVALAGCATAQTMQRPDVNMSEYQALATEGTGVVTGQVFLRTMVGEVRYGAGSEVLLNPVTTYSTFWYANQYQKGHRLTAPDPSIEPYIIKTQADGEGRFRFENVPPGDYYLTSSVFWQVPLGRFSSTQSGGFISQRITVENDKETRQILTR